MIGKGAPAEIARREKRASREAAYRKASFAVRRRDGGRCRLCGSAFGLETHHLRPRSLVGKAKRDAMDNLLTLCGGPNSCHEHVTRKIIKLYAGSEGANGFVRAERWSTDEGGYVVFRERA